jgi:hypothetical protein
MYRVMFYHSEDSHETILAYNLLLSSAIELLRKSAQKHGVKFTRNMRRIERKYATYSVAYYIEQQ